MDALLYFVIWAGLFFLIMRFGCGAHVMGHGHGQANQDGVDKITGSASESLTWVPPPEDLDPVCGKTVRTDTAKSSVHDGMVYYFCSRDCREIFEAAPEQYLGTGNKDSTTQLEVSHG